MMKKIGTMRTMMKTIGITLLALVTLILKLALVLVLTVVLMFGCSTNQTNCFIEGVFVNEEYRLTVTAIDEATFKSKDGINVVEDISITRTNKYYQLELVKLGATPEQDELLTFINLVQVSAKAEPCHYRDDRGNSIGPQIIQNITKYVIDYNGEVMLLKEVNNI